MALKVTCRRDRADLRTHIYNMDTPQDWNEERDKRKVRRAMRRLRKREEELDSALKIILNYMADFGCGESSDNPSLTGLMVRDDSGLEPLFAELEPYLEPPILSEGRTEVNEG